MADAIEIIINAVDSASEVFQSIIDSATGMADGISGAVDEASSTFDEISENVAGFSDAVSSIDNSTLEELGEELGMSADEVQRLIETGADMGNLSAGFNEASVAADELEKEIQEDIDAMGELGSAGDVMAAQTFMDMANGMKDSMLGMADSAGTFNDSIMRASLEAQGAGISIDEMKNIVSDLSDTTGRAGGQIRESFIKATARGVTDMDSFKKMMEGAGAQATLFNTTIQAMGDKFSSMAQKNTLVDRSLAETGITMNELADAMGMTGATADEVKAKWKELDTNQRAAILGQAASMNEGKTANDEYKTSWAGLQEQLDIARGRLERIVGSVLLPVLIPAMQFAGTVLSGVGDIVQGLMSGPLGGLISIIGSLAGAFMIGVTGAAALRTFLGFLKIEMMLDTVATVFNTAAKILNGEASGVGAIANMLLSESFMASAAAAWTAAAGFLAAAWPLLLIVGAIALVVVAIYELGKAFHWWNDVGTMIDAIRAGLQKMWDAFINHPDVQAAISMISTALQTLWGWITQAGQAILDFFGVSAGSDWDVVKSIIDGIGVAWQLLTTPIRTVISIIQMVIGAFGEAYSSAGNLGAYIMDVLSPAFAWLSDLWASLVESVQPILDVFSQFQTGQTDLLTVITTVATSLWNVWSTLATALSSLVLQLVTNLFTWAVQAGMNFLMGIQTYLSQVPARVWSWLSNAYQRIVQAGQQWVSRGRSMASQFLNAVVSFFRQLPGRAYSALIQVVSRIISAGQQWVSNARNKASEVVNGVANRLSDLPDRISSALSGVVSAITSPFQQAYDTVKSTVDNIVNKASEALSAISGIDARGGDIVPDARGGDIVPDARGGDIVPDARGGDIVPDARGGDVIPVVSSDREDKPVEVNENINLTLDFKNVPSHLDTDTLVAALTDKDVLKAFVGNRDFQAMDLRVKGQLAGKVRRYNGA